MASPRQTIRLAADPARDQTPSHPRLVDAQPIALGERDVRAKRPPLLSFLLRWATARRFVRIAILMALDFAGVFLAIFTVLLFARSSMYADRGERPGFARILATLFQVTLVAVIFALVSGDHDYFSS